MPLQAVYETESDIPEPLKDFYKETDDGRFVIQGDGIKTQNDFDTFESAISKRLSETRERLTKTREQLNAFGGMTADEIAELKERAESSTGDKSKKLTDHPEYLRLQEQVREKDEKINSMESFIRDRDVRDNVMDTIMSVKDGPKVRADAIPDIVAIAQRELEKSDGGIYTKEGLQGVKPHQTTNEWLAAQLKTRRYWFEGSKGSGADGGNDEESQETIDNPFTHKGWNMTAQAKLINQDRAKAEKLAKQAGATIGGLRPPAK